jgi:hypothetical protein
MVRSCLIRRAALVVLALAAPGTGSTAAELKPQTVAAFDQYVRTTEDRLRDGGFLWLDGLPEARRAELRALTHKGELAIERVRLSALEERVASTGALVHHWVGTAFIPGATIEQALSLLQDYDHHQRIYSPTIARSRLIAREGDQFRFFLRFVMKKVITVVVDSDHEALFSQSGTDRAEGWIRSTRIAEVEDADTPGEREKPVGNDSGYLWRLNTYWRLQARDGGLYLQCESVSLTRGIPIGLGWVVGPFVTSIPRESLTFTLETTRKALVR